MQSFEKEGGFNFIFFLPTNILENVSKPLSLSFRLFKNTFAVEIVGFIEGLLVCTDFRYVLQFSPSLKLYYYSKRVHF